MFAVLPIPIILAQSRSGVGYDLPLDNMPEVIGKCMYATPCQSIAMVVACLMCCVRVCTRMCMIVLVLLSSTIQIVFWLGIFHNICVLPTVIYLRSDTVYFKRYVPMMSKTVQRMVERDTLGKGYPMSFQDPKCGGYTLAFFRGEDLLLVVPVKSKSIRWLLRESGLWPTSQDHPTWPCSCTLVLFKIQLD